MTITIADGRGALWQWGTGRRVKVDGGVEQVHYQNRCFGATIDVDVGTDGIAIIPDELLQDWHTLTVYAYVTDDTGAYTMVQQDFAVHKRAKPADYVYTPTEQKTLADMQRQIGDLSELETEAKGNLVAAINEAAASGGSGGTSDHSKLKNRDAADQHPMGAITGLTDALDGKQPTGDYLTADTLQSATDAALTQAKASGAFDGASGKDGTSGITPTIGDNGNWYLGDTDTGKPSRGAKGDKGDTGAGMDVTGATVGQIAKITAVDTDGKPTAWEPVDMPSGGKWVFAGSVTAESAGTALKVSNIHAKHILVSLYASCDNTSSRSYAIKLNDAISTVFANALPSDGKKHLWAVEFELLTAGDENYIYSRVLPVETHHTNTSNDPATTMYVTTINGTMWYRTSISEFESVTFLSLNGTALAGCIMNVWYR